MTKQIQRVRNVLRSILIKTRFYSKIRNKRFLQNFRQVSSEEARKMVDELRDTWKEPKIIPQQDEYIKQQLAQYSTGNANDTFDALINILVRNIPEAKSKSILEIGCSSGYNSEVLSLKGFSGKFSGCDCSEAFIESAERRYPDASWNVGDAVSLSYPDQSYNVVISGCCILHIYEYEKAISEAARVSSDVVVFHRTPIMNKSETAFYRIKAYGVEMLQIHFNESELLDLIQKNDLELLDAITIDTFPYWEGGDVFEMKTYLFKKRLA